MSVRDPDMSRFRPDVVVTPEVAAEVQPLIDRLQGTWDDPEDVADFDLTQAHHVQIDRHIWRCADCEYWCKHGELNDDDLCYGCRVR